MKIGLAIAPEEASPSAFVVFRDRLETSMAKAAALGYDGVELALSAREQAEPARIRRALAQEGLALPEKMAPVNALLNVAPAPLREALLIAFLDRLQRPSR